MNTKKIIFITGTDTGVGKTLLTALLLHHLRKNSVHALAIKPFCSGGLGDVHLLQSLQPGELSDAEANPFYFPQAIAPLVANQRRKPIRLAEVINCINSVKKKCDRLLIEGSGGFLVPLGVGYTVADLISHLDCKVLIAAHDRLGTINHTLLTINALKTIGIHRSNTAVVLMGQQKPDLSSQTNQKTLADLLKPIPVFAIPYLGTRVSTQKVVEKIVPRLQKSLKTMVE